jgi:broad specificity polyphosphatase/5'/3'-nucleotidase SurE
MIFTNFILTILFNPHQSTREEVSNTAFNFSLSCTETIFDEVRESQISDLDRRRRNHKEDIKEQNSRRNNSLYWINLFNEKENDEKENVEKETTEETNEETEVKNRKKIKQND